MYKGILLGHPLMSECKKFLTRHKPLSHRQWLERMEQSSGFDQQVDFFNTGPTVELLEQKIAGVKQPMGSGLALCIDDITVRLDF